MRPREQQPYVTLIPTWLKKVQYATAQDVVAEFGIHIKNARRYLELLRDRREIYIADWHKPARGREAPIYAFNDMPDLPLSEIEEKPSKPKTTAQRMRKHRSNKNAKTEKQ